jgi:hypothetical protein
MDLAQIFDLKNCLVLLAGLFQVWGKILLVRKEWVGWVLSILAVICFTASGTIAGLWAVYPINFFILIVSIIGIIQWRKKRNRKSLL